jgi:hypothetical protein
MKPKAMLLVDITVTEMLAVVLTLEVVTMLRCHRHHLSEVRAGVMSPLKLLRRF